jgi:Na+/H+ antiporter NhaD/arsenite permease-like protein
VWDAIAYRRDPGKDALPPRHGSIAVGGTINIVFLVGIVAAVLLQSVLARPWPSILQIGLALLSWLCTSRSVREHNAFTWTPIIEITVLFAGIFVTMVPALALLTQHSTDLGLTHAWQYFWLTGMLSSVLDNAPTYLSLASLAAGGRDLAALAQQDAIVLQAISAGAVFMGAMTYIANGPNFMVKSMAEEMGYPMPTFFGYLLYSGPVLLPIFAITTWLFFI